MRSFEQYVTVAVSNDTVSELERIAAAVGCNRSKLLRAAIHAFIRQDIDAVFDAVNKPCEVADA